MAASFILSSIKCGFQLPLG